MKKLTITGGLLRFDESSSSVDADGQATGDLGVERPGVTRLLHSKNSSNPSDDFVGRGIGRFVEIDDSSSVVALASALRERAQGGGADLM